MDINLLFKIAAIGILVAVLHQVLVRAGREDQAMMTTLAGLVIVLTMVIKEISTMTGKEVTKEKEDKIINAIMKDNVPKNIDKMF